MTAADKAPKLLFLVTEDSYFVSHRLPLAVAARAQGFDVSVATRVRNAGKIIEDAKLKLIPLDFDRGSLAPVREAKTIAKLAALYRREAPDIVHHVALKPILYGSLAARLAGTKSVVNAVTGLGYVFSSDSAKARLLRPVAERWLRMALGRPNARTIVQNNDDLAYLYDRHISPPDTVRHIPGSGVDMALFSPGPSPPGVPVVVFPARLIRPKGVFEFAEAARRLISEGHKARFALCGAPDPSNPASVSDAELRTLVEQGAVEHWGWRPDMPSVLAAATVVCLPSFYGEGVPKSLIEAAASGRAIVTTDTPGCREIVRHGINGWLVPARDTDALTTALREAITSPELVLRYGEEGRVLARSAYSSEEVIGRTLAVYAEVMGRPTRGTAETPPLDTADRAAPG